MKTILTTVCFP